LEKEAYYFTYYADLCLQDAYEGINDCAQLHADANEALASGHSFVHKNNMQKWKHLPYDCVTTGVDDSWFEN